MRSACAVDLTCSVHLPAGTAAYPVVFANAMPLVTVGPFAASTATDLARAEPWITRTRDCPLAGRVRSSLMTARPRSAYGPTPATVYALPDVALTLVDSTGGLDAGAPAGRMLTAYRSGCTRWYCETAP